MDNGVHPTYYPATNDLMNRLPTVTQKKKPTTDYSTYLAQDVPMKLTTTVSTKKLPVVIAPDNSNTLVYVISIAATGKLGIFDTFCQRGLVFQWQQWIYYIMLTASLVILLHTIWIHNEDLYGKQKPMRCTIRCRIYQFVNYPLWWTCTPYIRYPTHVINILCSITPHIFNPCPSNIGNVYQYFLHSVPSTPTNRTTKDTNRMIIRPHRHLLAP